MNIRRNTLTAVWICVCVFFATAFGLSFSPGISLKLDGGYTRFRIGDTNTNITELVRNWDNVAAQRGFGLPSVLKSLDIGMEGEAEIRLHIKPFLAAGLGFGRLIVEKNGNHMEMALPPPIWHQVQTQDSRISAMPIFANLYYFRPVFASGTLFAKIGAGYYVTKWWEKGRYDAETAETAPWWREWELDAEANGLGVHGGIGLEFKVVRWVSVAIEGYGRYANISGFKGDAIVRRSWTQPSSYPGGTLYYYEWKDDLTADWYGDVNLRTDVPGSTERNVRKAEVDLGGIGIRLGLIIRLR
jgi:hypothetical protein